MRSAWQTIACAALLVGTACGPRVLVVDDAGHEDDDDDGATTGRPPPPPEPGTSTTTTSPPTATATASSSDDPEPPDPTAGNGGFCMQTCQRAEDCCNGAPDCPSDDYPDNWACEDGRCVHGGCKSDDDCSFVPDDWICATTRHGAWCLPSCQTDDDCWIANDWTCSGITLDGQRYCKPGPTCGATPDFEPCEGVGSCDPESGWCVCHSDADCEQPDSACHIP